ncbi:TetR/AcrR family transcriptional regulator [Mycobacterium sp.]|jgi:AcrR family transcriptional regulator|uniref:TetR/AcrR family transcriptional regulator n=1 Tax=Mycobacterium sp. TaxID=1785 RepID=UPI002D637D50|nr:TetR family transcriptional regulator [Mycobacterium sp.]HZA12420.1 TetR family transcriptional regulator [Mycobacterium sp.]
MTLGLRERKKLDTRRALSDAAVELAFERGLENVTRDAIAARAGVSLRTFNNYFTGKYEAIAYRQLERLRRSLVSLRNKPADEPLWTAITEAILEPLESEGVPSMIPSARQLGEVRKVLLTPEIRAAVSKELGDEWVEAIAARTGTDPTHDMYPRLVTGIIRAVCDAAMDAYLTTDPPVPITSLLRQGFADVVVGVPAPEAHCPANPEVHH